MDSFEQQFTEHNVHTVLSQLRSTLDASADRELDDDALKYLDRLRQGVAFIVERLSSASPVLTGVAQLERLRVPTQNCLNELNQFSSNGNNAHLANASNQLDAALPLAAGIVSIEQPVPQVEAADAVGFKELAEHVIESLRNSVSTVTRDTEKTSQQATQLSERLAEQEKQLSTLNSQIGAKLEEIQSSFTSTQTSRQTVFEGLIQNFNEQHSSEIERLNNAAKEKLDYLQKKQKDAERIVHLIGNIGVTGNFKGAAAEEGKLANLFRVIALICFLCMVAVILYMGFISLHEKFELWLAVFRFAVGFAFLVPGVYAARESTRHRRAEARNRKTELELASIDSYLDSLDKPERDKIKSELAAKYFGGEEAFVAEDGDDVVNAKSMFKLVADLAKTLASKT